MSAFEARAEFDNAKFLDLYRRGLVPIYASCELRALHLFTVGLLPMLMKKNCSGRTCMDLV